MTRTWAGRIAVVAAWLLLAAVPGRAADADLEALVGAYLKTGREQATGTVAARAYVEPTRPTANPTPQPGVQVVLVPYSARLEAELEAVKAGLRDSVDAYTRAVGRVEGARVDHERALVEAGGGALVRSEVTDAQGAARLGDMPAGEWLVLAWYEGGHTAKRFGLRDQDAKRYPNVPTNVTYSIVTYWRSRVTVEPSRTVAVTFTDRNPWMTAPRQESGNPAAPRQKTKESSQPERR